MLNSIHCEIYGKKSSIGDKLALLKYVLSYRRIMCHWKTGFHLAEETEQKTSVPFPFPLQSSMLIWGDLHKSSTEQNY